MGTDACICCYFTTQYILPICIEDKKLTHEKGIDFRHKPQDIEYKALNLPLLPFFFYWVIVFFL